MKLRILAAAASCALLLAACDDNTGDFGTSLTHSSDKLNISAAAYGVTTQTIVADSVLSRNSVGYLGKVRDPETGAYVTGNCMIQFGVVDEPGFPAVKDSIKSRDSNDSIVADYCYIELFYNSFYGDSLAPMKLTAHEMGRTMNENRKYYSNFNPRAEGYLRSGGLKVDKSYTLTDLTVSDSLRRSKKYVPSIRIPITGNYTAPDGTTYNNLGTYIMRQYYNNRKLFADNYKFINNILRGFYFEHTGGLGSMADVSTSWLMVGYRGRETRKLANKAGNMVDSTYYYNGYASFAGTEEVLQTTYFDNDEGSIKRLADDSSCTYLKTSAGLFTEVTLPVDDILKGHDSDTLSSAKLVIPRINDTTTGKYRLNTPKTLLIVPKSMMYSFFEEGRLNDGRTSFLCTYNANSDNTYTFENIGNLIGYMNKNRDVADWNKAVIIPVTLTTRTNSQDRSVTITKIVNDMSLSTTRLRKGDGTTANIRLDVIYTRFAN